MEEESPQTKASNSKTRKRRLTWLIGGLAVLLSIATVVILLLPSWVEKRFNRVDQPPPHAASKEARRLHQNLFAADLHADSLLWNRKLSERRDYGHVDVPRLVEANMAFQVFSVVTKVPKGLNYASNSGDSDQITLLGMVQGWPPSTWISLFERALFQAEKLRSVIANADPKLMLVTDTQSLALLLQRRQQSKQISGALLSLEGAHALEGKLEHLDELYAAGFRMIGLVHLFDNSVGGSGQGVDKGGLTAFGKSLIGHLKKKRMIIDLAHASDALFTDVLKIASDVALVVSHTGVRGTCDKPRNLSDNQLRAIAATGGIIGIALFDYAICGSDIKDAVKAIRYSVNLVGVEHVALGSDFDGAVTTLFDVTGLPLLTEALSEDGFSESDIAKIMGGNVLRFLRANLPSG